MLGTSATPLRKAEQPGEADRTCADITRARALGWEPRVPLREGLLRSIAYIREHVVGGAVVSV